MPNPKLFCNTLYSFVGQDRTDDAIEYIRMCFQYQEEFSKKDFEDIDSILFGIDLYKLNKTVANCIALKVYYLRDNLALCDDFINRCKSLK